jgi:hypothetical protein
MHATIVSMHQSDLKRKILDDLVTDQHYLRGKEILQQGYVQQKIKEYEIRKMNYSCISIESMFLVLEN